MGVEKNISFEFMKPELFSSVKKVCSIIADAGGRAWLVGGSVRDCLRGFCSQDLDIEVFGLSAQDLQNELGQHFKLDLVGQSFGILKIKGLPFDVGLPRRESKQGLGHRGFEIYSDPFMPLAEAASRRDFTFNAIYVDPLTGEVEDPFGGVDDLNNGILRHTSPAFAEDPLRVLRGMQFVARFNLEAAAETVKLCRGIDMEGLAPERIHGEWVKLITLGDKPSLGLNFLHDTGWLSYFPELERLRGCPQDPTWHPEGDVWTHTLHCLDVFASEKTGNSWEDLVVGLAVLCHDLGKPDTTSCGDDGRIRSLGHEETGVTVTEEFLHRITNTQKLIQEVIPLVREHMRPSTLFNTEISDAGIRRLAVRVGRIDRLVRVARADALGRPPLSSNEYPAGDWLTERSEALGIASSIPEPLVLGRHLIQLGLEPGLRFGGLLTRCYDAQLAGKVNSVEEGLDFIRNLIR